MANVKYSELPPADTLTGTEIVSAVQGGTSVQTTAQAIAALAGGGGGDTLYSADGTIADAGRTVTIPANGNLAFSFDVSNVFSIQQDGTAYIMLVSNDNTVFTLSDGAAVFYAPVSLIPFVVANTVSFSVAGYSNTLNTNEGTGSSIIATLPEGAITGTTYHFAAVAVGFGIGITTTGGDTLKFWDVMAGSVRTATPSPLSYLWLNEGQSCTVVKVGATTWFATVNNGGTWVLDSPD